MQVGDIVKHFLTEQIGVVLEVRRDIGIHVLWTTQSQSLFGHGHKEKCGETRITVVTNA